MDTIQPDIPEVTPPRREQYVGSCRCGIRWGGYRMAHCSVCHQTFSTVGNFDRHRKNGACLKPRDVGLVPGGRSTLVWMMPGRDGDTDG